MRPLFSDCGSTGSPGWAVFLESILLQSQTTVSVSPCNHRWSTPFFALSLVAGSSVESAEAISGLQMWVRLCLKCSFESDRRFCGLRCGPTMVGDAKSEFQRLLTSPQMADPPKQL